MSANMTTRVQNMALTSRGIRIGLATVPVQRIKPSADAVRVQRALLAKPRSPDFWPLAVGAACAVGVAVMAFAGWLPGAGA